MSQLQRFPATARKLIALGAWVMGSSVEDRTARDIDLMVLWNLWPAAALLLPSTARPTSHGGWRWEEGGSTLDVWPDTLDRLASMPGFFCVAWHPMLPAESPWYPTW